MTEVEPGRWAGAVAGTATPAIDARLARRLVDSQFPQWADLPVRPVEVSGWDNRTFRLGDELTIRLPTGDWYARQVGKEQRWLPVLAPRLPLPIPVPAAMGAPG
ncbi:MAG TPA: phosphotransferase, partial [Kineosporiaceae bacterium]|nr:phosphotransferase [Kineosporiaceae bacterium]